MKTTILGLLFAAALAPVAMGTPILQVTGGGTITTSYVGEAFITPVGGPWTSIAFNFFADTGDTTAVAQGTLYLLNQEYLGTPGGLSSSTTGFVASANAVGNVYTFSSGVTLLSNTKYWVYATGSFAHADGGPANAFKQEYGSNGGNFAALFTSADFLLASSPSSPPPSNPTPEPGTIGLLGGGLALIGALRLRRR